MPLSLPPRGSDILRRFNSLDWKETDFSVVIDALSTLVAGSDTAKLIDEIIDAGYSREQVWAVYLDWLIAKANRLVALDRHAVRLLRNQMAGINEDTKCGLLKLLFLHADEAGLGVCRNLNE
jgi:hypothetical protein